MATLTIADLDNGKRDLQTVDAVANSREDFTQSRYGESVLTLAGALRRLGYEAPVPYASGINVTTGLVTVERDGVIYAPVASRVPFTTGDWDESQWRVVQNTNDDRRAFIFSTKTEADIAAATLPEGQFVDALDVQERYKVQGGDLVFVERLRSVNLAGNKRTLEGKLSESLSLLDFGAVGDGVSDDTTPYASAIAFAVENKVLIDGLGKVYKTTTRGEYLTCIKNATIIANTLTITYDHLGNSFQTGDRKWELGMTEYSTVRLGGGMPLASGWSRGAIAIGMGAIQKATAIHGAIAIGPNTLSQCTDANAPPYNIAIGDSSLTHVVRDGSTYGGTRNIAIGSLAMHYLRSGHMNVAIGRDCGHNLINATNNVLVGYGSGAGGGSPIGWSGGIEMQLGGSNATGVTAVGSTSLWKNIANYNTAVGTGAFSQVKSDPENTAVGFNAGRDVGKYKSYDNKLGFFDISVPGTYTISGDVVSVNLSSDAPIQLMPGDKVYLGVSSGDLAVEQGAAVVSTSENIRAFTFPNPKAGSSVGGSLTLKTVVTQQGYTTRSVGNVFLGHNAGLSRIDSTENIAIGADAFRAVNSSATVVGAPVSSNSVLIGTRAMRESLQLTNCTALGHNVGRWLSSGATANGAYSNLTLLGHDARFSGDNQVQLGNRDSTVYAYGAVQDRSDERDKADVRDTVLGLEFINDLRPVDFKWDMRDDYVQTKEDGTVEILPKDGSKKRGRYHHGVIAQELRAVMEKHGVDFGGFQDHSVNGGCDVLSVGYTELIAPLIKAVQELSARVQELEER